MKIRALYVLLGLTTFFSVNNALAGTQLDVPVGFPVEEQGVVKDVMYTLLPKEESQKIELFLLEPRSALLKPEKTLSFLGRLVSRLPQTVFFWPRLASYFLFSVDPKVPPIVQPGKSALEM